MHLVRLIVLYVAIWDVIVDPLHHPLLRLAARVLQPRTRNVDVIVEGAPAAQVPALVALPHRALLQAAHLHLHHHLLPHQAALHLLAAPLHQAARRLQAHLLVDADIIVVDLPLVPRLRLRLVVALPALQIAVVNAKDQRNMEAAHAPVLCLPLVELPVVVVAAGDENSNI